MKICRYNLPSFRESVRAEVTRRLERDHPCLDMRQGCIYWADQTVKVLAERGLRAVIQAGSASWPRIRPQDDDGIVMTHYSYMWEPSSSTTRMRLAQGLLPELHAWAAIPSRKELIDFTTGFQPALALMRGMTWPGDLPPDYLWATAQQMPARVVYRPSMDAINCVLRFLTRRVYV